MGIALPFHIRAINHVINRPLWGTSRHKGFIGSMILIIDLANISYTILFLNVESVEKPAKWLSLRFPKAIAALDIIIFIMAVQGSRDSFAFTLKACATIVQSESFNDRVGEIGTSWPAPTRCKSSLQSSGTVYRVEKVDYCSESADGLEQYAQRLYIIYRTFYIYNIYCIYI